MSRITPEWIAVDWGTTNLRVFAMRGPEVLARAQSEEGMGRLNRDGFESALHRLIEPWVNGGPVPIVACGMVGSRQGWIEAPYRAVPCKPLSEALTRAPSDLFGVHVISGLSQTQPADVMRGEETQIAGMLALNPSFDGVLCLPGTHTKWAHLSANEVVSFRTFMTGELFALLTDYSVLRHSVSSDAWEADSFAEGVATTLSRPEALAANLFNLRAAGLLHGTLAAQLRARLSGLLLGAELAAARPYWLGQNLAILGLGAQAKAYRDALASQGVSAVQVDSERATLAGLTAAYSHLKETA
ncbi:MAG: 2-dehydro-3-deoxygalactonokinase [Pseudomonadota bacterium]